MKQFVTVEIEYQYKIGPDTYSLQLKAPKIAEHAKPGQFVMVYLDKGELLLPRPISLCDVDKAAGTITLVYMTVGAGTQVMSQWQAGQHVKIMGPLGNGFTIDQRLQGKVAIVGGGMGAPPMLFLLKQLAKKGIKADVYLGFKHKFDLPGLFSLFTHNLQVATDDGSMGQKGTVMDLLAANSKTYSAIFSCGPIPMLRALAAHAKVNSTPCQVALEERMACGIGACKGCVVKTLVKQAALNPESEASSGAPMQTSYQLCCQYGPVYDSQEVAWDA